MNENKNFLKYLINITNTCVAEIRNSNTINFYGYIIFLHLSKMLKFSMRRRQMSQITFTFYLHILSSHSTIFFNNLWVKTAKTAAAMVKPKGTRFFSSELGLYKRRFISFWSNWNRSDEMKRN